MAETVVRCPGCRVGIKIKTVPPGKKAFACPKCKARVPYPEPEEEDEALDVVAVDDEDEEEQEEEPIAPRRRRRARRDEYDDEEEEDRPRRRKKRKRAEEPEEGPWLGALGAVFLCFLITFGGALLVNGTAGLPPGEDGPGGKLIGLGVGFAASLVLMPLGVISVKNRRAYGRWGFEVSGTLGVILGMIQAVVGGLMGGFTLYGLIFTLVNGG